MEVGDFKIASDCIEHVFILYTYTQEILASLEASLCPATLKRNLAITMTWQEKNRHISNCVFMYTRASCMPHLSSVNARQSVIGTRAPAHTVPQHTMHSEHSTCGARPTQQMRTSKSKFANPNSSPGNTVDNKQDQAQIHLGHTEPIEHKWKIIQRPLRILPPCRRVSMQQEDTRAREYDQQEKGKHPGQGHTTCEHGGTRVTGIRHAKARKTPESRACDLQWQEDTR